MSILKVIFVSVKILCHIAYCYLVALIHVFKPPTKKSVAGEIVLITGAGHGIGRQLALQISKLDTTAVLWDINKENNEKTAEEINKMGGKAFAYVCDITDSSQVANVAAKVRDDVGQVSILINNAGILNGAHILDLDEKAIRRIFELNILSHFWMDKEFLPNMMKENHGHILNVASMAGLDGVPTLTDYCSTKYAAVGLGEALRVELAVQGYSGIHVSTLCPMVVDTGMLKNYLCDIAPLLTPEEVAEAAINGLLRNYDIITVPSYVWFNIKLNNLFPRSTHGYLYKFGLIKVLPQYKKEI